MKTESSPYINRFLQPDTIIPDLSIPQSWNRYSYVTNRPVNFNDPIGHREVNGCSELAGGCNITQKVIDDDAQKLALLENENHKRKCKAGDYNYCSGWTNGSSRPITGIHTGVSVTFDVFVGSYTYEQEDFLFDWKSGTVYRAKTVGNGTFVGGLNGAEFEGYAGLTHVYGIPLSATPEQVNAMLSGPNQDLAFDVGVDVADLDGSYGKGLSIDLDPDTGTPVITSAGPMYTTETKIGGGVSLLPFPVDGGIQWGKSETTSEIAYQIPWWPFK